MPINPLLPPTSPLQAHDNPHELILLLLQRQEIPHNDGHRTNQSQVDHERPVQDAVVRVDDEEVGQGERAELVFYEVGFLQLVEDEVGGC